MIIHLLFSLLNLDIKAVDSKNGKFRNEEIVYKKYMIKAVNEVELFRNRRIITRFRKFNIG